MTFTGQDWRDAAGPTGGGDTSTPITAARLEDLETRLAAYADAVAAGGIELGTVSDLTTQSSTSVYPTLTALTGTSITVTVGARPLFIFFGAQLTNNSAANPVILSLLEDSVEVAFQRYDPPVAGTRQNNAWPTRRTPSAGSHTYQLALSVITSGTGQTRSSALSPAFIEVIQV